MGWLGDGSHRGQGCQAWTAVGLPPRYPRTQDQEQDSASLISTPWQDWSALEVRDLSQNQCWNWPKRTEGFSCRNVWNFAQGLKFMADFHSKISVCRHELGTSPPLIPTLVRITTWTITSWMDTVRKWCVTNKLSETDNTQFACTSWITHQCGSKTDLVGRRSWAPQYFAKVAMHQSDPSNN